MCNKVVPNNERNCKEIPAEGYGWKLFYHPAEGLYYSLITPMSYLHDAEGWSEWIGNFFKGEHGEEAFCFFLDEEEARRALEEWIIRGGNKYIVLRKIQYKQGIQERDETNFVAAKTWRVALCKRFRIVEK